MRKHIQFSKITFQGLLRIVLPLLFCFGSFYAKALTRTWIGYGAGGTASKTDISAAANWNGGTALLSTDDYVMTFSSASLGANGATGTFILSQSAVLNFKSLTISFAGNGAGLKKVIINASKNLTITNVFSITNSTNANADHEIDFNITAGTLSCGSVSINANGTGGSFGFPQLYLNVSNGATLVSAGTFNATVASNSWTTASVENSGIITINGSLTANSAGNVQVYFDANNGAVYNMNGAVSLGTSGVTGVFLSSFAAGTSTGKFYFRNNLTFGTLGFVDPLYNPQSYTFDGIGAQTLSVGNPSVYFSNLIIGEVNSPVVNVTGTANATLTANASSANLQVNNNAVLNLGSRTLNRSASGGTFTLNQASLLKLAGTTGGQPGSNFPSNFSTVNLSLASTVEYNGAAGSTQTIYASPSYGNLTLTNGIGTGPAIKNIAADASVRNTLTFNDNISFSIPSGISLTLKSNAVTTARVAEIITPSSVALVYGGSGSSKGKFIVERYISAVRGWRFLAVPTNGAEYIHDAWQEGQAANNTSLAGKGIQLTSNAFPNGYDLYSSTSSFKTYSPATASWVGVPTTLAPFDNSKGGYMTFIRGDRTVNAYQQAPTSTVLRTSGELYTGNRPFTVTGTNQFAAISNPFASAIDFTKIYAGSTGISEQFYVYDPKLGTPGIGGYQTITKIAGIWKAIPGGGSYPESGPVNPYIESGQAFFAYSTAGTGSFSIKENAKVSGSSLVSRDPAAGQARGQGLQTSLYFINADSSTILSDAVYNEFDDNYSNGIDELDARKSTNFGLNLSIRKADKLLVVERCRPVTENDTIFLNMTSVKLQHYRFEFMPENLIEPGLQAYLEDKYLATRAAVSMAGRTTVDFDIINAAGSYAADRFRIVFIKLTGPLPVTITSIAANRNSNKSILVDWKVESETGMDHYDIEHSGEGRNFTKIYTTAPMQNNGGSMAYNVIDGQPFEGENFYRIRAVSISGRVQYSAIAKVAALQQKASISVYPNPVTESIMNIHFPGRAEGIYKIQLVNFLGQVVYQSNIPVNGVNQIKAVSLGSHISSGTYQLSLTGTGGTKTTLQIVVE